MHAVPVVVEAPDHKMMLFDKGAFFGQHRVLLALRKRFRFIGVVKKSRLVRDNQVLPVRCGALQDSVGGHHGHRNSRNRSSRVARFESVPSLLKPRNADMRFDAVYNILRRERSLAGYGCWLVVLRYAGSRRDRGSQEDTGKFQHFSSRWFIRVVAAANAWTW
jgi:hypothetical protein